MQKRDPGIKAGPFLGKGPFCLAPLSPREPRVPERSPVHGCSRHLDIIGSFLHPFSLFRWICPSIRFDHSTEGSLLRTEGDNPLECREPLNQTSNVLCVQKDFFERYTILDHLAAGGVLRTVNTKRAQENPSQDRMRL